MAQPTAKAMYVCKYELCLQPVSAVIYLFLQWHQPGAAGGGREDLTFPPIKHKLEASYLLRFKHKYKGPITVCYCC